MPNPLKGEFDLSSCGDRGQYLSISTGYRKKKNPKNADMVEIWVTPRLLLEKKLDTTAAHFNPIMGNWKQEEAPVGMFWNWGNWDNLSCYDYLTSESTDNLSKRNLYENWEKSLGDCLRISTAMRRASLIMQNFVFCL